MDGFRGLFRILESFRRPTRPAILEWRLFYAQCRAHFDLINPSERWLQKIEINTIGLLPFQSHHRFRDYIPQFFRLCQWSAPSSIPAQNEPFSFTTPPRKALNTTVNHSLFHSIHAPIHRGSKEQMAAGDYQRPVSLDGL